MKKLLRLMTLTLFVGLMGTISTNQSVKAQTISDPGGVTCYATYDPTLFGGTRFWRCVPGGDCEDKRGKDLDDSSTCPE